MPVTVLVLATIVVAAYAVGVLLTRGKIVHGTSVGGIDVGGKTVAQAKAILRADLEAKATAPIPVTAASVTASIDPVQAGMTVDIDKSVDSIGATSLSPTSILRGFGKGTSHALDLEVDDTKLAAAVAAFATKVDRPLSEGSIHYHGVTPVAVQPVIGRTLQQPLAVSAIENRFKSLVGGTTPLNLAVTMTQPKTSAAQIDSALELAAQAVNGPLHLTYNNATVDVPAATLASVLTWTAQANGTVTASADPAKVQAAFVPLLGSVPSVTPTNAKIALVDGKPHITPSISSVAPDPSGLAAAVPAALAGDTRTLTVPGKTTDPAFTTADAEKLGIKEVISSFQTPHPCCAPRVHNITLIAGIVNNAIILPGQTFSLNGYVGERTAAKGFVSAPEINEGTEKQAIGGGVSQFATTMYNAAFFAGMKDVYHQPHTFWLTRYPAGREATVSWMNPDLKWQNTTPYGVLVQSWDDGNFTHVVFWGTKYWTVHDGSSGMTNQIPIVTTYLAPGEAVADCVAEAEHGEVGFTISIWRTLSLNGVQQGPRQTWVHRYSPQPNHICTPNSTASPSPGTSFSPGASGSPKPGKSTPGKPTIGTSPTSGKSPTPAPTTTPATPAVTKPTPSPTPKS